ncbi:MAG: DUF5685 family protein [Microscillaceae bacterium]|jgi:hypothetical protein|nr:DUF5685 family protein [Microscillaceae bacterium]
MLGHLKPIFCHLSSDSKQTYWAFYCGGCASLRRYNGLIHSSLLNNELTLLLCALQGEYQNLQLGSTACPATALLGRQKAWSHPAIDKASDLTLVLAWLKALDWHTDQPSFARKLVLKHLTKKANKILPLLLPDSQVLVSEYAELTRRNEADLSIIRQQTNLLSQMLVAEIAHTAQISDVVQTRVAQLFGLIGELIVLADHLLDLEKDMYGKQYNPILVYAQQNQTSLLEAYQWLKADYQRLSYQIIDKLAAESSFFREVLQASLHQLHLKIERALPFFLLDTQSEAWQGRMQIHRASFPHFPPEMFQPTADPCCESCANALATACLAACCQCSCQACSNALCATPEEREQRRQDRQNRRRR